MTLDVTKPVQTCSGLKARIVSTDFKGPDGQNIIAVVAHKGGREMVCTYYGDGCCFDANANLDLVNVPETKSYWLAILENGHTISNRDRKELSDCLNFKQVHAILHITEQDGEYKVFNEGTP